MRIKITLSLPVDITKKKKWFVASCRALDVASQGDTKEAARAHLEEALVVFLESCLERGVLEEVLRECGFAPGLPDEREAGAAQAPWDTVDIPIYLLTKHTDTSHCHLA